MRTATLERLQQHQVALAALLQRPALALTQGGANLVSSATF